LTIWYCEAECESLNYYYSAVMNFEIASSDYLSLTI